MTTDATITPKPTRCLASIGLLFQRMGRARAAMGSDVPRVFRAPPEMLEREAEAFRARTAAAKNQTSNNTTRED